MRHVKKLGEGEDSREKTEGIQPVLLMDWIAGAS
jgi:hypothetical protein